MKTEILSTSVLFHSALEKLFLSLGMAQGKIIFKENPWTAWQFFYFDLTKSLTVTVSVRLQKLINDLVKAISDIVLHDLFNPYLGS